jgi:hypothetical protein
MDHNPVEDSCLSVLTRFNGIWQQAPPLVIANIFRAQAKTTNRAYICKGNPTMKLTNHRIDVHQHVVPPFWAKELPSHGGDPSGPRSGDPSHTVLPQWSRETAIDLMDSQKIATGMLSLTAPGIVGWNNV